MPTPPIGVDEKMREFVTPRQREAIDAWIRLGDTSACAEALGVTVDRFRGLLSEARRRASRRGYNKLEDAEGLAPPGFKVKGKSILYKADPETGQLRATQQWVKTQIEDDHKLSILMDAAQDFAEPFQNLSTFVPEPAKGEYEKDLMSVYPMGDPHFGMYAWAMECGDDFNLEICERTLVNAVDRLVSLSPPSEQALILNLGDFFHADNMQNMTARSGHVLDVDTRWPKVLQLGLRAIRRCIDRALEKHRIVHVINEIGNHDDHSSMFLSVFLEGYYRNNPRVQINTSPSTFHWLRHGKCFIGVTHGHNTKPQQLGQIMATDRPKDWGETRHRYWYTGHVHHDSLKEYHGCTVETFRTLAAKDAWHSAKGYRSLRDMKCDVLHKEHGKQVRFTVTIDQVM
jgi:hypothetical protein